LRQLQLKKYIYQVISEYFEALGKSHGRKDSSQAAAAEEVQIESIALILSKNEDISLRVADLA